MLDMTYRIYLRWPDKTTTDKTTTEDEQVADLAYTRLTARVDLRGRNVGVAYTRDGQQVRYFELDKEAPSGALPSTSSAPSL